MIETIVEMAQEAVKNRIESLESILDFKLPEFIEKREPEISDAILQVRAEAAAHSASTFFQLPEIPVVEGDTICVYLNGEGTMLDDVLQYSIDQFKEMNCTTFEDMTKVWSHECGHRLLQNLFTSSWASELGADFFAGARSEMLGLPRSDFEDFLADTAPCETHPGGELRMQAMDYGRFAVQQMRAMGIEPTWENCIATFQMSPFAGMTYEGYLADFNFGTPGIDYIPDPAIDNVLTGPTFNGETFASGPRYDEGPGGVVIVTDIFGGQHTYMNMDCALACTDIFSGAPNQDYLNFGVSDASVDTSPADSSEPERPQLDPYFQAMADKLDKSNELEGQRDYAVEQYKDAKSRHDYDAMAKWANTANDFQTSIDLLWPEASYSLDHKAPGID